MKMKLALGMALIAVPAMAAEPIQGNWKTASGETVEATRCSKQYCLTLSVMVGVALRNSLVSF